MSSSDARKLRKTHMKIRRKAAQEDIIIDFDFTAGSFHFHSPIITTDIGISKAHAYALNAAGLPALPKVQYRFLIDTGADGYLVKHKIAERAGLKLINSNQQIHGIGVDTTGKIYMGAVFFGFPSKITPGIVHNIEINTQIMSGTLQSDNFDGLLGRDVLSKFEMRYNGKTGRVTMKYLR